DCLRLCGYVTGAIAREDSCTITSTTRGQSSRSITPTTMVRIFSLEITSCGDKGWSSSRGTWRSWPSSEVEDKGEGRPMKTRYSGEFSPAYCVALTMFLICGFCSRSVWGQRQEASVDPLQIPTSHNFIPHFEEANGRKVLYVDGRPFTVLAVEIPWWDLI